MSRSIGDQTGQITPGRWTTKYNRHLESKVSGDLRDCSFQPAGASGSSMTASLKTDRIFRFRVKREHGAFPAGADFEYGWKLVKLIPAEMYIHGQTFDIYNRGPLAMKLRFA